MDASFYTYNTPKGRITIAARSGKIVRLSFSTVDFDGVCRPSEVTNAAANQMQEYLAGTRHVFSVPVDAFGTDFQRAVWERVRAIPYGQVRTYADIAASIGRVGAARAVGSALSKNPVLVMVPCHRVIGATGRLGGYAAGIKVKEFLLELERQHS